MAGVPHDRPEGLLRLEDKLTIALGRMDEKFSTFMEEAREILREQQRFVSELATRQAVVEERLRRAESDIAITTEEAHKAHRRLDVAANSRSEEVGLRRGVVVGITLASALGGGTVTAALVQAFQ